MLTGIPKLDSHYSGLGIRCNVRLQVKSHEDIRLSLENVKFSHVNGKVPVSQESYEGSNWRNVLLPDFDNVSDEIETLLRIPVSFSLKDSEIKTLTVSGAEQEWSLNFKKALIVLFQAKMEQSTLDLEMNTINKESFGPKNYWKVSEETIDGVCDVIYQINELPEYYVKESSHLFPKLESCTTNKFYEIVKTKEMDSCRNSPIYQFLKPAASSSSCDSIKCMPQVTGTASSVTRFYACGSRSDLLLNSIVNEGELVRHPMGLKTESMVTGTKQTLLLESVKTIQTELPKPSQPRTLESLMYEYITKGNTLRSQIGKIPKIPQSELKDSLVYKYLPRHFLPHPVSSETNERLSPEKVKTELKELLEELVEDMTSVEDIPKREIPSKITSIVRAFTLLKADDMKSLYEEMKTKYSTYEYSFSTLGHDHKTNQFQYKEKLSVFKNIFFDSVTVCGTTPSVLFLKEMIRSEEMNKVQAITCLALMPHHIITPSNEVFTSLFELIKSDVIEKSHILYSTAVLSFTNLIQKACLDTSRKIQYPVSIFGEFCDPQSEIVAENWIPYLNKELKTSSHDRRNVIIMALGSMTHKDVIPILLPLVEGLDSDRTSMPYHKNQYSMEGENIFNADLADHRNVSRFLSIYALSKSGSKHPELVLPIVFSIYSNPAENSHLRIAAFNVMMSLNPPMSYLQKVVATSWYEKDSYVLRTVVSAIYSLSYQQQQQTTTSHTELVKKCQVIFPLLKKMSGYWGTSGSIFSSDYLTHLGAGYQSLTSWISSYRSIIPSHIYSKFEYLLGDYQFKPFEVAFNLQGGENIYQRFNEVFGPLSVSEEKEFLTKSEINKLPESEQKKIHKSLGGRYTTESRKVAEETFEHHSSESSKFQQKFENLKTTLHREWVKVIEQLKIETRENGPLSSLIYLNMFDDVSFFGSITEISSSLIREKVSLLLANPTKYAKTVCGKTPVNFQRIMNVASSEYLIPSEIGFPIIMETNMPVTLSIRGHIEVGCEIHKPTLTMDTHIMSSGNFHTLVGTYCPFTKQMLATGFKEEFTVNVPARTSVTLNVFSSELKLIVTPLHTTKPIDMLYFNNKPFTVSKSVYDLKPRMYDSSIKVIKSNTPLRRIELPFGSFMGLNFKSIVETESRYLDFSYMMKMAKMYNYNVLNMWRFVFSPSSMSDIEEVPSLRRHVYRIQYDPMTSKTKEIEVVLSLGCATKKEDSELKYHHVERKPFVEMKHEKSLLMKLYPYSVVSRPISEKVHGSRQEVLKKVMSDKLNLRSGFGLVFNFETRLKGSVPRSISYRLTFGSGTSHSNKQEWHLLWENEPMSHTMTQKICIDGSSNIPSIPFWDIDTIHSTNLGFELYNTIGFGRTCEESKIKIVGTSRVSEKHRHFSKESPLVHECKDLIRREVPGALTSYPCEEARRLAKTIDEFDFKLTYENIPSAIVSYESKITETLRYLLWPYLQGQETFVASRSMEGEDREVMVRFVFDKSSNTWSLKIYRPEEQIVFSHIRMPYPWNVFFPITLGESNVVRSLTSLYGSSWTPKCSIEKNWLRTFDNRSLPLHLDDCFHLITGDCSSTYRFGVLARSLPNTFNKELKIYLNKTEIIVRPSQHFSKYVRDLEIVVNETVVFVAKDSWKVFREQISHTPIVEIYRSKDNVIKINAPEYHLTLFFDGEHISTESSWLLKDKLCGICGDMNRQKLADLRGPKRCVYSKPELEIASYRISTPQCSALEGTIKEMLSTERSRCAKYEEIPTEVYKSFMALVGKCSRHEHMILERAEEMCFSLVPVMQCGAQCSPKPRQLASKKVSFTCLKNGRVAELYREKVLQGQELPELKHKEESFTTSILVPQSCVSVTTGHPMISNSGIPSSLPSSVHSGNSAFNKHESTPGRHPRRRY